MAEIAAAAAVTSSVVSLFDVCKGLISSIVKGITQVKLNDDGIVNCVQKARYLERYIESIERNCKECHWMSRDTQEELTIKLEYVNSLLDNVCKRCNELSTKQKKWKFFNASGMKQLMDTSFEDLRVVDNHLDVINKQIKHTKAVPIISPAVSEVDFHLPAQIREVTANPNGKYLNVSWEDIENSPSNLEKYNIYVDDNLRAFYSLSTTDIQSNKHVYSVRLQLNDSCVHLHTVQVSAVNKAGEEGLKSSQVAVLMNQCPPDVKPTGLKVETALSRTSVVLSVDRPINYDDMGKTICKIHGYANRKIQIEKEAKFIESCNPQSSILNFEIGRIDPVWDCRVAVCFCNEHGEGMRSKEISFKIDSLHPSTPKLSSKQITSRTVEVDIFTETNPGSVSHCYVFQKQDGGDKIVMELEEPIKQAGDNPIYHDIKGLQPDTMYQFYVISVSAADQRTYESDHLPVKTKAE